MSEDSPVLDAAARVRAGLPLRTGRTLLRPLGQHDVGAVLACRGLPEVALHLAHPPLDRAGAGELVAGWLADGSAVTVAVELQGRVVGDVRLMVRPGSAKAPATTDEVEGWLGYAVQPDVQGRGLATEAVRAVVGLALGAGGLRRLTARVFSGAVASSRVLAKVGFTHEGTERAAVLAPDGRTWWDDEAWSLLREELVPPAAGRTVRPS